MNRERTSPLNDDAEQSNSRLSILKSSCLTMLKIVLSILTIYIFWDLGGTLVESWSYSDPIETSNSESQSNDFWNDPDRISSKFTVNDSSLTSSIFQGTSEQLETELIDNLEQVGKKWERLNLLDSQKIRMIKQLAKSRKAEQDHSNTIVRSSDKWKIVKGNAKNPSFTLFIDLNSISTEESKQESFREVAVSWMMGFPIVQDQPVNRWKIFGFHLIDRIENTQGGSNGLMTESFTIPDICQEEIRIGTHPVWSISFHTQVTMNEMIESMREHWNCEQNIESYNNGEKTFWIFKPIDSPIKSIEVYVQLDQENRLRGMIHTK